MKAVIIGNSGSGKTWLAKKLTALASSPVVHLDGIYWQPGGFDQKKQPTEIAALIDSARSQPAWVVEGVFGNLASAFLPDADMLVWLDLNWSVCEGRLRARGSESKVHMTRLQSEAGLAKLLEWASAYGRRTGPQSFSGHLELFETFNKPKARLKNASDVDDLLATTQKKGLVEAVRAFGRWC